MRKPVFFAGVALVAVAVGAMAYWNTTGARTEKANYRTAAAERGAIVAAVKATGTLTPVSTVLVGSQLSGQVVEILSDYNAEVKAGQIMARLASDQILTRRDAARADVMQGEADLAVKSARVDRQRATFERAKAAMFDQTAQRDRAAAQLADAKRTFDRQNDLFGTGSGSRVALDTARTQQDVQKAALASAEAQINSAKAELTGLEVDIKLAEAEVMASRAVIASRKARLRDIEIDLERTEIKSPVEGVVVQKSVELGQTVAASLSSPTLFTVAQDLRQIEIYANVDESDVGRIADSQRVTFTVTAYPNRTFEGRVKQVRLGAQTIQNVVIYTAVITVANMDRALLPGMTANLSVITQEKQDVLKVPNAALRWRPASAVATGAPSPASTTAAPPLSLDAPAGPNPFAQSGGQSRGGGQGGSRRITDELRETLVGELKPTVDELKAIDGVIAEVRPRIGVAMQSANSPDERRAKMREVRQEMVAKMRSALPEAKRADFDAIAARMGGNGGRQQRAGAAPSAPGRVYILGEGGEPQAVNVMLGSSDGVMTEIAPGAIAAGQQLIVGGGPRPAPAQRSAFGSPSAGGGPRAF